MHTQCLLLMLQCLSPTRTRSPPTLPLPTGFSQDGDMENSDVVIGESATMSAAPYFIGGVSINSIVLADVCRLCQTLSHRLLMKRRSVVSLPAGSNNYG
jgi:hypothetical protein